MSEKVYVADSSLIIPAIYEASFVAEKFYVGSSKDDRILKTVLKLANNLGIKKRSSILDLDAIPQHTVKEQKDSPLHWGKLAIENLTRHLGVDKIGYLSAAYNVSSYSDHLPNLISQIAIQTNLNLESIPKEFPYYGCAGGIFALNEAMHYCQTFKKAAIVFIFDQCTWGAVFNYEKDHPLFVSDLKTNLLFSDGAVALLLIPEQLRESFNTPLLEIKDIQLNFKLGNSIGFQNNHFVIGNVKEFMPGLVSEITIKPLLERNRLSINDISEWSIHQGGTSVLKRFCEPDILGLSNEQIEPSYQAFQEYGNLSAPSCFMVLHHFLKQGHNNKQSSNRYGSVVGFGAGYYLGAFLYERLNSC